MSDIPVTPVWKVMPADHPKQTAENYINPLFIESPNGDVIRITQCSHIHATSEQTALAKEIVTACNSFPEFLESLNVMTQLCRLKYGNLDAEVYSEILKAEAAIAKAIGETK